jgi:phosphoenolpyruvate-protein kinase (PTS system EI component)
MLYTWRIEPEEILKIKELLTEAGRTASRRYALRPAMEARHMVEVPSAVQLADRFSAGRWTF